MLGEIVKYKGFITLETGSTVEAIQYGVCIGYDDHTIYTSFIHPVERYPYQWNNDEFDLLNITRSFRIGFHRSRLIEVGSSIQQIKLSQSSMF